MPIYVIAVLEGYRRTERFGRSMSSEVIDFGTNRKRVYDFLLVRHSNLGHNLHRFGDIVGFLCSLVTPTLFHHNFGVFPLHQIAHVGVSPSRSFRLFGREIIFEVFQPVWKSHLNVTDRQTDLLWHNRALLSIAR